MRQLYCWLFHRAHHYRIGPQRLCWLCDDPGRPPGAPGWDYRRAPLRGSFAW